MAFVEGAWSPLLQTGTPLQVDAFLAGLCLAIVFLLIIFILVGVWVYRDAESRGMSGAAWAIGVILGGVFGGAIVGIIILVVYLVVRKDRPVGGYYAPYGTYPPGAPYPPAGTYPPPSGYPPPSPPTPPQAPPAAPAAGPSEPPAAAASLTCRQCGTPIPAGATFCPACGAKV